MLWEYVSVHENNPTWDPYNVRIPTEATGFNPGSQLPSGYYYRYIDPSSLTGISEDVNSSKEKEWDCGVRYKSNEHRLVGIQWDNDHFNEGFYIGVGKVDGKLHVTGQNVVDDSAEIYFAQIRTIPVPSGGTHDDHTVNHIDISVEGTATVTIPLAYGDYYDENGNVIYTATQADHKITMTQNIDITKKDIKNAEITAFTKDTEGIQTEVSNAFYVTVSSTFDYWQDGDESVRNDCPAIWWFGQGDNWRSGKIIGDGDTMSGMDFALGSTKTENET